MQDIPYGNKIEALSVLPAGEPFLFVDTDTLIVGDLATVPFDFDRPTASMKREGTWPSQELYGPGYNEIWGSLYEKFGLDFESSLDTSYPDEFWRSVSLFQCRVLLLFLSEEIWRDLSKISPVKFVTIRQRLVCQEMKPWLGSGGFAFGDPQSGRWTRAGSVRYVGP